MNVIQTAWVGNGFRPIYEKREIKRGKNKGRFEVVYRGRGNRFKKAIILPVNLMEKKG